MKHKHIEWFSEEEDRRRFQKQTLFALIIVAIVFATIILRLFSLQILKGDYYLELSEKNRLRIHRLIPPRGLILDRKGRLIVDNRLGFDLFYRPTNKKNKLTEGEIKLVASILQIDETILNKIIKGASSYSPPKLASDLDYDTLARLEEALNVIGRNRGLEIQLTPKRNYLYPLLIPHLLGYLREVSPSELAKNPRVYQEGDLVGKSGIEQAYEEYLRGTAGIEWVEENAFHQRLRTIKTEPAKVGKNLYLTIDLDLNLKVAEIFEKRAGVVIVMDVNTGDILAAYSNPVFDPSIFSGKLKPEQWQDLVNNPDRPLLNKIIAGVYPPGSVFKPVVALAALQNGIITPRYEILCTGSYHIGDYDYGCWKREGHGIVNLHMGLVNSCDVYFYKVAEMTGIDKLSEFARKCGFGKRTGIEISGEMSGLIPDRFWKREVKKQPWHLGETLFFGIGQGYVLTTPMQIAVFYSALANGGKLLKPRLVERIEDPLTGKIEMTKVEITGEIPAKKEYIKMVNKALLDVVEFGTGRQAKIDGIKVAGKTGTAQVVSMRNNKAEIEDHAWFAAFAPFDEPEICVVVLVEHGGKGGAVAAPIAREIMKAYFEQKGVLKTETPSEDEDETTRN